MRKWGKSVADDGSSTYDSSSSSDDQESESYSKLKHEPLRQTSRSSLVEIPPMPKVVHDRADFDPDFQLKDTPRKPTRSG